VEERAFQARVTARLGTGTSVAKAWKRVRLSALRNCHPEGVHRSAKQNDGQPKDLCTPRQRWLCVHHAQPGEAPRHWQAQGKEGSQGKGTASSRAVNVPLNCHSEGLQSPRNLLCACGAGALARETSLQFPKRESLQHRGRAGLQARVKRPKGAGL